ncbi:response regulator transcription factor [Leucobacter sp. OH1287]|uniref:response regulator n=1 Tax=Leucobacter sp. OH1287 TaxID=2491049 RepID=UPI000F5E4E61|nr:response regulator transcription factor [Leucobacter sp. OH1287]RRD61835.1 DNA-binding response regulator [Leucobacter sp. OH1287]
MGNMIRVALVDDQAIFRTGIKMVLESQPDITVVGEAETGLQAVSEYSGWDADVILMDVRMPELDGIQATVQILAGRDCEKPRIVMLTTFDLDDAVARALRAGASGYLLKDAQPEMLLASIRAAASGAPIISANAAIELLKLEAKSQATQVSREAEFSEILTEREYAIFKLAAQGLSNQEIAKHEFVTESTVKTHISRIFQKLGYRDRVQLVIDAYEAGIISPGQAL